MTNKEKGSNFSITINSDGNVGIGEVSESFVARNKLHIYEHNERKTGREMKNKKSWSEWRKQIINKILNKPAVDIIDEINSPIHYTHGGIEVVEILKKKMTPEMYEGYLMGNLLAYIFRYRLKGNKLKDLQKAEVYLKWLIKEHKDDK